MVLSRRKWQRKLKHVKRINLFELNTLNGFYFKYEFVVKIIHGPKSFTEQLYCNHKIINRQRQSSLATDAICTIQFQSFRYLLSVDCFIKIGQILYHMHGEHETEPNRTEQSRKKNVKFITYYTFKFVIKRFLITNRTKQMCEKKNNNNIQQGQLHSKNYLHCLVRHKMDYRSWSCWTLITYFFFPT